MKFNHGYSLVEMLVVLALVGLLVSMITLSVGLSGNTGQDAERIGVVLEQLLSSASDEAVLRAQPIGLIFVPPRSAGAGRWGLRWASWQQQTWQNLPDLHADRELPEGLVPRLTIDGAELAASDLARIHENGMPALVFYPTGESTLFSLQLIDEAVAGRLVQLSNHGTGQIVRLTQ